MKHTLQFALAVIFLPSFFTECIKAEQVVFSEIHYNPKGDKPEFIEIYNLTATIKDISKWKMTNGVEYEFPDFDEADTSRTFFKEMGENPSFIC
jgi:hypothetical protein